MPGIYTDTGYTDVFVWKIETEADRGTYSLIANGQPTGPHLQICGLSQHDLMCLSQHIDAALAGEAGPVTEPVPAAEIPF